METVEHSLIRMFRDGPEVSLNGIADGIADDGRLVRSSLPLPPWWPASMYFLRVVPGAAGVGHEHGHRRSR